MQQEILVFEKKYQLKSPWKFYDKMLFHEYFIQSGLNVLHMCFKSANCHFSIIIYFIQNMKLKKGVIFTFLQNEKVTMFDPVT